MTAYYRTYDKHGNRSGYATEPQYNGQAALERDFPPACPTCGGGMAGCGYTPYLALVGRGLQAAQDIGVALIKGEAAPDQPVYVAWCGKGHIYHDVLVEELLGDGSGS